MKQVKITAIRKVQHDDLIAQDGYYKQLMDCDDD